MSAEKQSQKSDMSTSKVCPEQPSNRRMTKHQAARKLAQLVEADMERKGLSEDKKNERVRRFVDHVDAVIAERAK